MYLAFQSTLPVRGATGGNPLPKPSTKISIHAPREGSDRCPSCQEKRIRISIHAPREGSDTAFSASTLTYTAFQSTLPVRGATKAAEIASWLYGFQSTLPVRGATGISTPVCGQCGISIHAPREGSDLLLR